jgi:hypothetical protein
LSLETPFKIGWGFTFPYPTASSRFIPLLCIHQLTASQKQKLVFYSSAFHKILTLALGNPQVIQIKKFHKKDREFNKVLIRKLH